MITTCKGYLLKESRGDFVAEDGRKIEYHNALFWNLDDANMFKASVPSDADALPEGQVHCNLFFEVKAGEKFTKLLYSSYELAE